jgi:hypothetical protein
LISIKESSPTSYNKGKYYISPKLSIKVSLENFPNVSPWNFPKLSPIISPINFPNAPFEEEESFKTLSNPLTPEILNLLLENLMVSNIPQQPSQ